MDANRLLAFIVRSVYWSTAPSKTENDMAGNTENDVTYSILCLLL